MEFNYLSKKEKMKIAYELSRKIKMSMSKVINLLNEMSHLESVIESAEEINAERGMGAVSIGFSSYDIERIQTGKEKKRLRYITNLLFPIYESSWNQPHIDFNENDLPF